MTCKHERKSGEACRYGCEDLGKQYADSMFAPVVLTAEDEDAIHALLDDDVQEYPTDYCDYCELDGHTFRSCPKRDDYPVGS